VWQAFGMKLQNAERRREKLNGSTVKWLNRWKHPRGNLQMVGIQRRSSQVKLRQTLELKNSTGGRPPGEKLQASKDQMVRVPWRTGNLAKKHEIAKQSQTENGLIA